MKSLLLLAVLFSLLQGACGKGDKTAASRSNRTPSSTNPTSGGTTRTWAAVTETVTFCDYPVCSGSGGFTVQADGTYQIAIGLAGTGKLTAGELASFTAVANAAAEQVGAVMNCANNPPLLGASRFDLNLLFSDHSEQKFISITKQSSCYFGDVQAADALHLQMRELELKYDARVIAPGQS